LEGEIFGKPVAVPAEVLVEALRLDAVKPGEVCIEDFRDGERGTNMMAHECRSGFPV
jgi:hypothetical protein